MTCMLCVTIHCLGFDSTLVVGLLLYGLGFWTYARVLPPAHMLSGHQGAPRICQVYLSVFTGFACPSNERFRVKFRVPFGSLSYRSRNVA
jgi:hypothetical protein